MPRAFPNPQLMQQIASLMPHYCDKCGHKHLKGDLEVVNIDVDKIVCKLECTNCKNVYVFQVNSPADGVLNTKKSSIKSDMNTDELKRFTEVDEIVSEEILDVYISLSAIETIEDFKLLFESNS
jgi:hypothetical protein